MAAEILNVGFIGNGKSTNRYHAPFILRLKDKMKIKTIWSRNHAHDKWAEIPGVIYTGDLDAMLADPEIGLVVITTPHMFHYEFCKKVIAAGKNCLMDKPFANTKAEAEELFALAAEKGVILMGYQNRRFDSDFLTAQKVAASGKLGEILEVESHYDYYRPYVPEEAGAYSRDNSYVYGHACHTLDQVISWFGKPDSIHYDVKQTLGSGRMNDYFDIDMNYGRCKVSVKSSYYRVKSRPKWVVYGRRGMFVKETEDRQEEHLKLFYMPDHDDFGLDRSQDYGTLIYYDENDIYHEEKIPTVQGGYEKYYDALYETIVNGAEWLVKPEQTIYLMQMLEESLQGLV
ncbi:MAG: Gfo/Idh/MocA family oxidoreductase [Eubacteriales bacterium]